MTMGMYWIEPPWISICSVQTYQTKYRYLYTVNRDKTFWWNLVIWGRFYDLVQGWLADFRYVLTAFKL
jgi:hypothetical protein